MNEMSRNISSAIGVRYPNFYDLGPPSPSRLLRFMPQGVSLHELAERDTQTFYQLQYAAKKGDIVQIIGIVEKKDPVENVYFDYNFWKVSQPPVFDEEEKTHSWSISSPTNDKLSPASIPQRDILQVLPPDNAHNYFRVSVRITMEEES